MPRTAPPSPANPSAEELERLRSGLRLMAVRALGDAAAADEVAQETLVRLVSAIRGGRISLDGAGLGAYAHGIARHILADRGRERARRRLDPLPAEHHPRALREQGRDPLAALVSAEERERLRLALRQLSAADQEILRLSFFDGLKPGEIATKLDEPAARVRKRKSRALERLRAAFLGPAGGHDRDADAKMDGSGDPEGTAVSQGMSP